MTVAFSKVIFFRILLGKKKESSIFGKLRKLWISEVKCFFSAELLRGLNMAMCIENLPEGYRVCNFSQICLTVESVLGFWWAWYFWGHPVGNRVGGRSGQWVGQGGRCCSGFRNRQGPDVDRQGPDVAVTFPFCGDPQKQRWCGEACVRGHPGVTFLLSWAEAALCISHP